MESLENMNVKEKIALLSDIQNLLENEELKDGFKQLGSGKIIWELISEHLQTVTEKLLGAPQENSAESNETISEMGKLLSLVKAVNASPLIQILSKIASRGLAPIQDNQHMSEQSSQQNARAQGVRQGPGNPIASTPKVGTMGFL